MDQAALVWMDLYMRFFRPFCAKLGLSLVVVTGSLSSCIQVIKPARDFSRYTPPVPPDYAQPSNWAALPNQRDSADAVPYGTSLRDQQATAAADVFFVHQIGRAHV